MHSKCLIFVFINAIVCKLNINNMGEFKWNKETEISAKITMKI